MQEDYLLLLLLCTPLIAAAAIAIYNSQSLLSLLGVLLGAIAGAILITLSGIYWLQVFHRRWMESQAAGFIFVPVMLPICAYTGAIAGTSLVAMVTGREGASIGFQIIAIGLTIVLSGLIPSAIVALPSFSTSDQGNKLIVVPIFVICAGVVSAWLSRQLAHLLAG